MASNHSLLRNDIIISDQTVSGRRRKKHPFISNHSSQQHHFRYAGRAGTGSTVNTHRDINDISNVQLEQAVRSLQCFEGLQERQDTTYRSFALKYIESILHRWSHQVNRDLASGRHTTTGAHPPVRYPLRDSSCTGSGSDKPNEAATTGSSQRSFAAVVASGSDKSRSSASSTLLTVNTSSAIAQAKMPNAWNQPFGKNSTTDINLQNPIPNVTHPNAWEQPTTTRTLTNDENKQKPIPNAWSRPSSILPLKVKTTVDQVLTPALIPFGSYRLGVHSVTSDLDLLTLAPPYITRNDFFSSLVDILQNDKRCKNVHPIPTAYTPVIKFILQCGEKSAASTDDEGIHNIHIDLVFARVSDTTKLQEYHKRTTVAIQYRIDDTDLQEQDEIGIRSLNGARVTQMILDSVRNDVRKFQIVLCAVKQWAQVRGIYSNVLGFLGGVNWAILVAWVCKHYPDANVSRTLNIFFDVFSKWQWNIPVLLGDKIADSPPICDTLTQTRAIQLQAWNPSVNPRDRLHLMPIITPAYPSMNSSYNVDFPQLRCIQHEMILTNSMLSRSTPKANKVNTSPENIYSKLFQPSDFFERHEQYIQINISSTNEADFTKWFRFVESKLRNLISSLETTEVHAWPFARFFEVNKYQSKTDKIVETCQTSSKVRGYEKCLFIGLRFAPGIDAIDVRHLTMDFLFKVNNWDNRNESTMELTLAYLSASDIPLYVIESLKEEYLGETIVPIKSVCSCFSKDGSLDSETTAPASDDEEDDDKDLHDELASTLKY